MRVLPFVFLTVAAATLVGCDSTTATESNVQKKTLVAVATATNGPGAPSIHTNGLLANKDEMRLSFKVGGVIKAIAVHEGEHVRRGQKLAEIEQAEVNSQVEQVRQSAVKADRAVERGERLYADKVISLEQLEDLRTQAAVAQAALNGAQFNMSYASIVAPNDGTVLRRLAEERELVNAGSPIVIIGAEDSGYVVRAGLADREIVQVRLGDLAEVRLDAYPGEILQGHIAELATAADPATGLFPVEVALDKSKLRLASGLVTKLSIVPAASSASAHVYVPIGAIVEGNGQKASVYVVGQDHAQRRPVEVAFIEGERVALKQGIAAGEQVVTDGALFIDDGEAVMVEPTLQASQGPAKTPALKTASK